MKAKFALFVSTALTAFVIVMVVGLITILKSTPKPAEPVSIEAAAEIVLPQPADPTQPIEPTQQVVPTQPDPSPAVPQPVILSPQDAAAIAASVMGKQDFASVGITNLNGVDAYMFTFITGEIVYIGFNGQVLSITLPQVATVITSVPTQAPPAPAAPVVYHTASGSDGESSGEGSEGGED
jgi:hypothetical protein